MMIDGKMERWKDGSMDWVGLGWIGLDRVGLAWNGMDGWIDGSMDGYVYLGMRHIYIII